LISLFCCSARSSEIRGAELYPAFFSTLFEFLYVKISARTN
jgi:hypothetical protein